ncbi:hypothetical protein RF11_14290 [Thelohanellus kitauei]|uniref:Uncharacterized protein n=1 Tax=Thelohanellus kitauei TaxID=669202 RepID=A0A0C2IQ09_THEKT|nr:hypothetical protein RF11_14290 [Thelohanellus kitauei]
MEISNDELTDVEKVDNVIDSGIRNHTIKNVYRSYVLVIQPITRPLKEFRLTRDDYDYERVKEFQCLVIMPFKKYSKSITVNLRIYNLSDTLRQHSLFEIELTGWRIACEKRIPKKFVKPHFIYDESFNVMDVFYSTVETCYTHIINDAFYDGFDSDFIILNSAYVVEYTHNDHIFENFFHVMYEYGNRSEKTGILIFEQKDRFDNELIIQSHSNQRISDSKQDYHQ